MTIDPSRISERRANIVSTVGIVGLTAVLLLLLGRVAQLQLAPSERLRKEMEPRVSVRADLPIRGDLLDRRGRVLSTTRVGHRVVVDPTQLKTPIDESIVKLAGLIGQRPEDVGERIIKRVIENARREQLRQSLAPLAHAEGTGGVVALRSAIRGLLEAPDVPPSVPSAGVEPVAPASTPAPTGAPDAALASEAAPPVMLDIDSPDATDPSRPKPSALRPIRYLPMSRLLTESQVAAVRAARIRGVILERVMVREYPGGVEVAPIVGMVGFGHKGALGVERTLDKELVGRPGSIAYVRDARGRPLWIEPGQVRPAEPGRDIRLSIDLELQRLATQELQRGVTDADAAGGRLVVLDPLTGEILAMVDIVRQVSDAKPYPWIKVPPPQPQPPGTRPNRRAQPRPPEPPPPPAARYVTIHRRPNPDQIPALEPNRCVEAIYEPGSTFKPFVWAVISELGRARVDEIFDTEGGRWTTSYGRYIEDVTRRASMTWADVLINSSNIGMIKGAERMSFRELHDAVRRFGFGRRTGLPLPGEATGIVTNMKAWSRYTQTSVAYGHEVAVTPVQMVRAFAAFCRPGPLAGTLPPLRLTAVTPDDIRGAVIERVLPAHIAEKTRNVMRGVAANVERRLADGSQGSEVGWKYSMFGKSGTAEIPLTPPGPGLRRPRGKGYYDDQYNSSFIAGGPAEDPKLVVLCVIDDPGPELVRKKLHRGSTVAGPVVRRVMERSLEYLGVQPSPTAPAAAPAVAQNQ